MIFFLLAYATGCAPTGMVSRTNLVDLYQEENAFTGIPALVYHSGDSSSLVITEINLGDMRYQNIPNTELKASAWRLRYRLLDSYETRLVLDSGSVTTGDTLQAVKQSTYLQSLQVKLKPPATGLLEIELTDLNRKQSVKRYFPVDRSSAFTRQNFMVVSEGNYPLFRDWLAEGEQVRITCSDPKIRELHVRCYFRDFPLARPPFTEERQDVFNYSADSVYTVPVINGKTGFIQLNKEGFYHFQADTTVKEGLTLFRYPPGFPEITSTAQLVSPLRYICTKAEYEEMMHANDQKEAVDHFWLKTAGSAERARTLIQKYYTGVEEANHYFSSYHEGWKTDRGIIYVIFGPPDYVYRGNYTEEWLYGEPENRNSLRFTFIQVNNPFTGNDYMLLRSPSMKDPWYITVQSWRR